MQSREFLFFPNRVALCAGKAVNNLRRDSDKIGSVSCDRSVSIHIDRTERYPLARAVKISYRGGGLGNGRGAPAAGALNCDQGLNGYLKAEDEVQRFISAPLLFHGV